MMRALPVRPAVLAALCGAQAALAQTIIPDGQSTGNDSPAIEQAREEGRPEPIAYKLTPTRMDNSDGSHGLDLNLRISRGPHYTWLALYQDSSGANQWRTGYEYRIDEENYRLLLSGTWAGGGYVSGSVAGEVGTSTFAILGWGRSNLRNIYSLFPDPADALTLGVGTRTIENVDLAAYRLLDDRLHTGRRIDHLVARIKLPDRQRLTIDLSHKNGPDTNGRHISGNSYNITYDWRDWFIRIARDAYVSFAPFTQTRVAIGMRF